MLYSPSPSNFLSFIQEHIFIEKEYVERAQERSPQVCRQGDRVVSVSDPLCGRQAGWSFVSLARSSRILPSLILSSSQCMGETPEGEDFEAFIGAEKAQELKQLFSRWIHKIYRTFFSALRRCSCLPVHHASSIRLATF